MVNADGTVDYTPNANYNGPDSFSYTVEDNEGNVSNVATVNLTIDNTQEPPVAVDDSATTAEDTPVTIDVLSNDSDPDGTVDPSTVTIVTPPSNGTLVVNADGTVDYTPNPNYNGPDSFSYTVEDNEGNVSNVATVNLTIDNTQEPPVAVDDSAITAEDTPVTISILDNDSDPDGTLDPSTVTITTPPANGTLVVNADGTVTYTPNANYSGPDSFVYTVEDNEGNVSNPATVDIEVDFENDPPVAVGGAASGAEDTALVLNWGQFGVSDADSDDADLGVRIASLPGDGQLQHFNGVAWVAVALSQQFSKADIDSGNLRFMPDADESGSDAYGGSGTGDQQADYASFSFAPTDGNSQGALATVTIDIAAVADAPTLHAHLSEATLARSTVFSEDFNDGDYTTPSWSPVRLLDNTFTDDPSSGKTSSEEDLFDDVAWDGQTSNNEWNNENWTVENGGTSRQQELHYNFGGGGASDDAQGMMAYSDLGASDRASTSYSVSADMWGNVPSQQNNGIGLVFGYQDAGNYFLARWENPGTAYQPGGSLFNSYPGQANQLSLVQMVGGVAVDLGSFENFQQADWFNLRVEVTADAIRVIADDGTATYNGTDAQIEYSYGSVSGGATTAPALNTIGMYVFDNDFGVAFDNILLEKLSYQYELDLAAFLNDTDGSESLSAVTLSNLPAGIELTAANGSPVTISGATATVAVTPGVETTLTVNSEAELSANEVNGIVGTVTASEQTGGSAQDTDNVKVEVLGTGAGETLTGGADDEWVDGDAGDDFVIGGAGNDQLLGGLGSDTFAWSLADAGSNGAPAQDSVVDFETAPGTDVLDLRDLLQGESSAGGNLADYLHFEQSDAGTVVHVSSNGGFSGGYSPAQENQSITLEGVDLFSNGLDTDQQVIADLLAKGKLITD